VFVGFVIGAMAAALLGHAGLALAILWPTAAAAVAIWAVSAAQLARRPPPAPLRPLLAIHLAPASLFATVAALTGQDILALLFGVVAAAILAALALSARWLAEGGFSPLWGAFTFPLAAFAGAMIRLGDAWGGFGLGMLALACVAVPAIGWGVLRMWPRGTLADRTNAATA
jgi:tellurite resistance protein